MKVLQINIFGNLSTGRIAVDIIRTLKEHGYDGSVAFSRNDIADDVESIKFGSKISVYLDGILTRITDRAGFFSKYATKQLIEEIKKYNPDIIHLHNLHGYYINIQLLFNYLNKINKPVVWTLHDCWSFTGHCCNFEASGCEKWKEGCNKCKWIKLYPSSLVDNSKWNYEKKKSLFTSVDNMVLVTPSVWLSDLVKQSFMRKYEIIVIHNGYDKNTFKPTAGNWRKSHHLENKEIILGVAGTWTSTKGLADLIELSKKLDGKYVIVVVGVSEKQLKELPDSIVGIRRTFDSRELAEIYTEAEFFVNPTYDDNFPNVNLEALACGTPVITYRTGGSPEAIDSSCGRIVNKGDVEEVANIIKTESFLSDACIARAYQFTREQSYAEYIKLYERLLE